MVIIHNEREHSTILYNPSFIKDIVGICVFMGKNVCLLLALPLVCFLHLTLSKTVTS